MATGGAGERKGGLIATSVTNKLKRVRMKRQGQKTGGAEGLPAAFGAESQRSGAAAVVVNQGLVAIFKVIFNGGEERVGKIAIFGEIFAGGQGN